MTARASLAAFAVVAALVGAPVPAYAGTCSDAIATRLYTQARRAFDEKRYDDSITLLKEANACTPNPVYLANIARAHEEAGRPKDALAAWRSYLAVVNDPNERARAEGRIQVLTKTVEDQEQTDRAASEAAARKSAAPPEPPRKEPEARPPPPAPKSGVSAAPLVVTGIGVVALGAGVFLGLRASAKHDDAVAEPAVDRAESLQSSARDLGHAANIMLIGGAIVTAGGLVWLGVDLFRPQPGTRSASARVSGLVGPRGIGLRATF